MPVGARVWLKGTAAGGSTFQRSRLVQVDDRGRFTEPGFGPGTYTLYLEPAPAAILVPGPTFRHQDADTELGVCQFDLRSGFRIRDGAGRLRSGDAIEVTADGSWRTGSQRVEGKLTWQADGDALLPVNAPEESTWSLSVVTPSRLGSERVTQDGLTLRPGQTALVTLDLPDPAHTSSVELLERVADGRLVPLSHAKVDYVIRAGEAGRGGTGNTNADGTIVLPCADDCTVLLYVRHPQRGDVLGWRGKPADLEGGQIVFAREWRQLALEVQDADGRGLEGVCVQALQRKGAGAGLGLVQRKAWTDARGHCVFDDLPLDLSYSLGYSVGAEGASSNAFVPLTDDALVLSAQTPSPVVVRIRGYRLRGTVVGPRGPLAWRRFWILAMEDGAAKTITATQGIVTDQNGTFVVDGIPEGTFVLQELGARNTPARLSEAFPFRSQADQVQVRFP